ncbi:MAG: imelysin family protein [Caldilineaceae bacterium]
MLYKTTLLLASILLATLLQACQPAAPTPNSAQQSDAAQPNESAAELAGIKDYLLDQAAQLQNSSAQLQQAADAYYALAEQSQFDYAALWRDHGAEVAELVETARAAWVEASPLYEKMEGIVAGTPSLAEFDVILDAGASGTDDPENAVPFDLTLPNGAVLAKPGNLFGVTESTLWGTYAEYSAADVTADFNGNGAVDFGESLPDANVLKASADALHSYTSDLLAAAQMWSPTPSDAFTALIVMIPTMNEYFGSWRDSRFVAGAESTQRDFVAISRLADMQDILGGLEVVYAQVQPLAAAVDAEQSTQIATGLSNLKDFVADIYKQEQNGKRFSAEEADLLGAEAQNRATNVTGQISQVAAQLNIPIAD